MIFITVELPNVPPSGVHEQRVVRMIEKSLVREPGTFTRGFKVTVLEPVPPTPTQTPQPVQVTKKKVAKKTGT